MGRKNEGNLVRAGEFVTYIKYGGVGCEKAIPAAGASFFTSNFAKILTKGSGTLLYWLGTKTTLIANGIEGSSQLYIQEKADRPTDDAQQQGRMSALPPQKGEHTAEILREWLGKNQEKINAFRSHGVIL